MVKIDAHPEPISGTTSNITSHKWCVIPKLIKKKNGIEIEWLLFNKYIMYIFYIRFRSSKINHDEKRKIGRHQKFSSQKKSRHSLEITNPFRIYLRQSHSRTMRKIAYIPRFVLYYNTF